MAKLQSTGAISFCDIRGAFHTPCYTAGTNGVRSYTSPGTFNYVVPAGTTSMSVLIVGAGGGGQGGSFGLCGSSGGSGIVRNRGGGGGGAGGSWLYIPNWTVTPGETLSITVGAGGAGGPPHSYGASTAYSGSTGGWSSLQRSSAGCMGFILYGGGGGGPAACGGFGTGGKGFCGSSFTPGFSGGLQYIGTATLCGITHYTSLVGVGGHVQCGKPCVAWSPPDHNSVSDYIGGGGGAGTWLAGLDHCGVYRGTNGGNRIYKEGGRGGTGAIIKICGFTSGGILVGQGGGGGGGCHYTGGCNGFGQLATNTSSIYTAVIAPDGFGTTTFCGYGGGGASCCSPAGNGHGWVQTSVEGILYGSSTTATYLVAGNGGGGGGSGGLYCGGCCGTQSRAAGAGGTGGNGGVFLYAPSSGAAGAVLFNSLYRGGALVPCIPANSRIPTSGQIQVCEFYGAQTQFVYTYHLPACSYATSFCLVANLNAAGFPFSCSHGATALQANIYICGVLGACGACAPAAMNLGPASAYPQPPVINITIGSSGVITGHGGGKNWSGGGCGGNAICLGSTLTSIVNYGVIQGGGGASCGQYCMLAAGAGYPTATGQAGNVGEGSPNGNLFSGGHFQQYCNSGKKSGGHHYNGCGGGWVSNHGCYSANTTGYGGGSNSPPGYAFTSKSGISACCVSWPGCHKGTIRGR